MTAKERVLAALSQHTYAMCDDCLSIAADLSARQIAYATSTALGREGRIVRARGLCGACLKFKIVNRSVARVTLSPDELTPVQSDVETRRWYWEGNIQSRLVRWLRERGYDIVQEADTATREAGKDIIAAAADGTELWVSVKGFPERSSHVQARHWFAGAVFDLILYRAERADVRLALAFPESFTTYASLAARVAWLRASMPFTIYWVSESGEVRVE